MSDPKNFRLDSDFPMDKIIYFYEGTHNYSTTYTPTFITFNHNLPSAPLLTGVYSTDNWQSSGAVPYTAGSSIRLSANSTQVKIWAYNSNGGQFKIRLYGLQLASDNNAFDETSSLAQAMISSSDYNYLKLVEASSTTIASANGSATITHNLGYCPVVLAWRWHNNPSELYGWEPMEFSEGMADSTATKNGIKITTTNTTFYSDEATTVQYRIYADEAE